MSSCPFLSRYQSSSPQGWESTRIFSDHRSRHGPIDVVFGILEESFRIHFGDAGKAFGSVLTGVRKSLASDTSPVHVFADARATAGKLNLVGALRPYKLSALARTIALVGPSKFGARVVDFGCGDNLLGALLLEQAPHVRSVVGVDVVLPQAGIPAQAGLMFVHHDGSTQLREASASVDTIIARYSLHHLKLSEHPMLMAEFARVLRPGGRLIVVEDTYSRTLSPLCANSLSQRLMSLDNDEILLALALMDASSALLYEETMQFPFSFRSIEEWCAECAAHGLETEQLLFWGVPFFSLFQALCGVMTFRLVD